METQEMDREASFGDKYVVPDIFSRGRYLAFSLFKYSCHLPYRSV